MLCNIVRDKSLEATNSAGLALALLAQHARGLALALLGTDAARDSRQAVLLLNLPGSAYEVPLLAQLNKIRDIHLNGTSLDAVGLLLEKKGVMLLAEKSHNIFSWEFIQAAITNYYVIGGVLLCGIGMVLWLYVLSQFNLSYIYPFGAVLYIIVALLGYWLLGEPLTAIKLTGIGVIIAGCVLINL